MKRTFQPSNRKEKKQNMDSVKKKWQLLNGRRVLASRRAKGRKEINCI